MAVSLNNSKKENFMAKTDTNVILRSKDPSNLNKDELILLALAVVLDADASEDTKEAIRFAVAENLTDRQYQEILGYPALGRALRLGLRFQTHAARP